MKRCGTVVAVIGVVIFMFRGGPNHVVKAAEDVSQPDSHARQKAVIALEAKFKIPKTDNEANEMASRIENSFSSISATVSAIAAKGKASLSLRRYDDAYETYTQLLASANLDATRSLLIREANAGRSYALLKSVQDRVNEAVRTRELTPEALEKIRADLKLIIQMGAGQGYIARASLLLGEVEVFAGSPSEGLILAEKFLAETYADSIAVEQKTLQIMQMHVLVARAARLLGDYAKALQACDSVESIYGRLARNQQENSNISLTRAAALFERFMTLFVSEAAAADIDAAGKEVIARRPESRYANIVKMYMRPPASMPTP